jgi:hypothetical protein
MMLTGRIDGVAVHGDPVCDGFGGRGWGEGVVGVLLRSFLEGSGI